MKQINTTENFSNKLESKRIQREISCSTQSYTTYRFDIWDNKIVGFKNFDV